MSSVTNARNLHLVMTEQCLIMQVFLTHNCSLEPIRHRLEAFCHAHISLLQSWSQGVDVKEWIFPVVDSHSAWSICRFKALIANDGDVQIHISACNFDSFKPKIINILYLTLHL